MKNNNQKQLIEYILSQYFAIIDMLTFNSLDNATIDLIKEFFDIEYEEIFNEDKEEYKQYVILTKKLKYSKPYCYLYFYL